MRSPKVANHEIQGAQPLSLNMKKKFPVAQGQKLVACGTRELLEHSPDCMIHNYI